MCFQQTLGGNKTYTGLHRDVQDGRITRALVNTLWGDDTCQPLQRNRHINNYKDFSGSG